MLRMIRFEFSKLFHRGIVVGAVIALLAINLCILRSTTIETVLPDGTKLSGREAVAYNQSVAARYAGDFTDDTIARIVSDLAAEYPDKYAEIVSEERVDGSLPTIYQQAVLFIPTSGYKEAAKQAQEQGGSVSPLNEYGLISMADLFADFDQPLQYGFSDSWYRFVTGYASSFISIAVVALMVIIIGVSTIFSSEYSLKTDALILTTQYGKNRQIIAKLLTCIMFATVIMGGLFVMSCAVYAPQYGLDGWNADIQTNIWLMFNRVLIPMNNLQLIFFALLLAWLAGIFTAGLTAVLSAVTKTPFSSLIIALTVFILPGIFRQTLDGAVRDSLIVFPVNAVNTPEVIRTHTYAGSIFYGQPFAPLQWIVIASVTVLILSGITAYNVFKSHQVKG